MPLEDPPPLPRPYQNITGQPYNSETPYLFCVESSDPNSDEILSYGYQHWPYRSHLKSSARTCDLCRLIHEEFLMNTNSVPHDDEYNFFITRRDNHQQGFLVWTQGDRPGVIWRVGAFSCCIDTSDVWSMRTPESGDITARRTAKNWVDTCVNNHGGLCGPPNGQQQDPLLPTRVLDIGPLPTSSVTPTPVKLLKVKQYQRGEYATLSYSWGTVNDSYKTTKLNVNDYMNKKIDIHVPIPKTIADAIEITRFMGIPYLWVDAYCIIQNDPKDFNREGPKMLEYYGNSRVTITASASSDAQRGTFHRRVLPNYTRFEYLSINGRQGTVFVTALDPDKENIQRKHLLFDDDPITTRGWTLQERILSTRNIIYSTHQMYYECNRHFLSEDGVSIDGRYLSTNRNTKDLRLFPTIGTQDRRSQWDILVALYSARDLTDPNQNKFLAISGLAKRFGQFFSSDKYYAGLWKKRFIEQLFWTTDTPSNPLVGPSAWLSDWPPPFSNYRAPSWSWACLDSGVQSLNPDGWIYRAQKYATFQPPTLVPPDPSNYTDDGAYYSQIGFAQVIINAPMVPIKFIGVSTQDGQVLNWAHSDDPNQVISFPFETRFDYEFAYSELQNMSIYALALGRDPELNRDGINSINYLCLLVTRANGGDVNGNEAYRRMGTIWLNELRMQDRAISYMDKSQYKDITLV
ncbi:heterokaryon incompatibility protein-domain-containing protein [Flammula alnicola]|nr:heterokaryon incompatibility protein-domain-containing protein [Flammula alnicola]